MTSVFAVIGVFICLVFVLFLWRLNDTRIDKNVWRELAKAAHRSPALFDYSKIEDLPEPAQRYFRYTVPPKSPLRTVAEIEMSGELGLGTKDDPKYKPMWARQILAPPYGFVWRLRSGAIRGSDVTTSQTSWTRFWLFGFVPVVRISGNIDHYRSAFGRMVAEGAFWTPAAFIPDAHVQWEEVDASSARAIVRFGEFEQAVEITVLESGQPTHVLIQRWSNANTDKEYRWQSFGGYLSEFSEFEGYKLPTRVEGGHLIGTDGYFPFFKATITGIRFV